MEYQNMNDVMNPGKVIAEALSRTDKKEYLRDLGLYELNALDKDDYYWLIHEESKNSNVTNYNVSESKAESYSC